MLRLVKASSLIVKNKFAGNTLPTTREVLEHFYYFWCIRQLLMDTGPKFLSKISGLSDVHGLVQAEVVGLWKKAGLPIVNSKSVQNKLSELLIDLMLQGKRSKRLNSATVDWLEILFDTSKRRSGISETCQVYKDKCLSSCKFENRISAAELKFLLDQRSRGMTLSKDKSFNNRTQKGVIKVKRRHEVEINVVSATTFSKRKAAENCYVHRILPNKFTVCLCIVCKCHFKGPGMVLY